jgi:translation initiation factor 4A
MDKQEWNEIVESSTAIKSKKIGPKDHPKDQSSATDQKVESFDDFELMDLKHNLLRGLFTYGFERPSRIQQCTIPVIKSRRDLIAQSQSGTGKTGSFTTGILQIIDETKKYPQAIILAPTRELSQQIESVTKDLGRFLNVKTSLCVGGTKVTDNIEDVKDSHIVIGTPGRIYDLIDRNAFSSEKILCLVMDEADQLLDKEFVPQTRNIVRRLKDDAQICAFSATLSETALSVTSKFMNQPVNLLVRRENLSLDLISQYRIDVGEERYKLDSLNDLYEKLSIGQCIIYVNFKDKTIWLQEKLIESGHSAIAMHGGLTPLERTEIMKKFRSGEYRVLISTDLLARGIDVQQVSYVINYDLPNIENYLHRIGRSGRFGKKGVAINFVTRRDNRSFREIEDHYKIKIEEMPEPDELNNYLKK